jgi:hypothetical protein
MSWQRWTAFAVVCRNFADALLTVYAQVAAAPSCGTPTNAAASRATTTGRA